VAMRNLLGVFLCVCDYQKWQFGFQNKPFQILIIVIWGSWGLRFIVCFVIDSGMALTIK